MDRKRTLNSMCENRTLTAPTMDGKIKAPPPAGRMELVTLEIFVIQPPVLLALPPETSTVSMARPPSLGLANVLSAMTARDDDFNPR